MRSRPGQKECYLRFFVYEGFLKKQTLQTVALLIMRLISGNSPFWGRLWGGRLGDGVAGRVLEWFGGLLVGGVVGGVGGWGGGFWLVVRRGGFLPVNILILRLMQYIGVRRGRGGATALPRSPFWEFLLWISQKKRVCYSQYSSPPQSQPSLLSFSLRPFFSELVSS